MKLFSVVFIFAVFICGATNAFTGARLEMQKFFSTQAECLNKAVAQGIKKLTYEITPGVSF